MEAVAISRDVWVVYNLNTECCLDAGGTRGIARDVMRTDRQALCVPEYVRERSANWGSGEDRRRGVAKTDAGR